MRLEDLAGLATALLDAHAVVTRLDEELKTAKARVMLLGETTLPCAMQELGVQSFTLASGQTVGLKKEVYASLTEDNLPACVRWLEEHEADGIVKRTVTMRFGKEEGERVRTIVAELRQEGLEPDVNYAIHGGTLKAFIKERLELGLPIDLELFRARAVFVAKIS